MRSRPASGPKRRPNEWIAERLRALGRTQSELAQHMGVPAPRISDILNGGRRVQIDELRLMAEFLDLSTDAIADALGGGRKANGGDHGAGGKPKPAVEMQSVRNSALDSVGSFSTLRSRDRDLPIYGAAEGGNGVMILDSDPIEYGERPANLLGVVGAYGVYIVNDSMAPAYEQGDKVHVHPGRPLKPGRDALFIAETADGTRHATVKRLVKSTDKAWKVQQFNPPRVFELPKKTWQRAFRIVGSERAD